MAQKSNLSVNQKKDRALKLLKKVENEPPKYAIAQLMGITTETLRRWENEDDQFNTELEEILYEKRAKLVGKAQEGLHRCIAENHYPAIRDTLRTQDPDNWTEPEETKVTTVNIMYLNIGRNGTNGKTNGKRIVNGRHKLK